MQNVYPPPPKGKILLLSLALSQLLQSADITFSSTDDTSNTATQNYAKYDFLSQTLTIIDSTQGGNYFSLLKEGDTPISPRPTDQGVRISESSNGNATPVPKNSVITINGIKPDGQKGNWYDNITGLSDEPKQIVFDIPKSDLIIGNKVTLGEANPYSYLEIKSKTLTIQSGADVTFSTSYSKLETGSVVVKSGGAFGITPANALASSFVKDAVLNDFVFNGNLTLENGSTLKMGDMLGGAMPSLSVNGKATIGNIKFLTFMPAGQIKKGKVLSASKGLEIRGSLTPDVQALYVLKDFMYVNPSQASDSRSIFYMVAKVDANDIYTFDFSNDGNTLYATPVLTKKAKSQDFVALVDGKKKEVAHALYDTLVSKYGCSGDTCSNSNGESDATDAYLGLKAYLEKNNISTSYASYTLLASTPQTPPKSSSTTPTTTGFDNIDAKLAVIKEGINNSLAENIKNSSNNLLAVNFVNTMMQGYNDTPIELLNEVKSNLSMSASISSFLRNDIHTSLALASRYASFSFAPKVSQVNSLQTQAFLDNDLDPKESISSFSPSLSNSLWANAFGGANLLGSEVGASYGLNLGYDKNLENALIGTYLSYEYATLKPSLLSLNAHNIKLGVYSRIQEGGNEVDLELSSLLSIISQESITKALDSLSTANYLSSLTELKTTYGYAFLEGDFKLKPLVGLALSFSYTPGFKEEGDIIKDFSSFNNFNTSLQAGLEFRANFSNKGFLYTLLSIEQDLYNSLHSLSINSQSLPITQDLKTYAQVLLGGEIAVSKDWNIALSLGAKQSIVGSKDYEDKTINETYISGSVGVGYRF